MKMSHASSQQWEKYTCPHSVNWDICAVISAQKVNNNTCQNLKPINFLSSSFTYFIMKNNTISTNHFYSKEVQHCIPIYTTHMPHNTRLYPEVDHTTINSAMCTCTTNTLIIHFCRHFCLLVLSINRKHIIIVCRYSMCLFLNQSFIL